MRHCEHCNGEYTPVRSDQRFCEAKCRVYNSSNTTVTGKVEDVTGNTTSVTHEVSTDGVDTTLTTTHTKPVYIHMGLCTKHKGSSKATCGCS